MDRAERTALLNAVWNDGVETDCANQVLTDLDVAHLLVTLAEDLDTFPCGNPHCKGCRITRSIWWDLFDDLNERLQAKLVSIVERLEVTLPERDEVGEPYHVVPTAQR